MFKLGVVLSGASLVAGQVTTVASYCQALWDSCPNMHGFSNNATIHTQLCATTMGAFTPGNLGDVDMNTLGCRQRYLTNSTLNATATKCQYAGPSGGGRCGSLLDAACMGATSACAGAPNPSYADPASCKAGLGGFVAQWGYKQGAAAGAEDSLECRLYHAIVGLATNYNDTNGLDHCTHFNATGGPCSGNAISTNANHYCETVTYHCKTPTTQQWPQATTSDGMNECLASVGVFSDTVKDARASATGNSLGCREYHAQAAASLDPAVHCEHAGPSGGKACGTYTEAWIALAGVAKCSGNASVDVARATSDIKDATTLAKMIPIGDNNGTYNINQVWDNTQRCRLYHLTTASVTQSHCSHGSISGGGVCGSYVDNLCTFIQGACGFAANSTYQFTDSAACKSALTSITAGVEGDTSNNTLQCRFYHAGVAASYATGGSKASATDAAAQMKAHCTHVLVGSTLAGSCGLTASKAPTPSTKNDATAVSVLVAASVTAFSMLAF